MSVRGIERFLEQWEMNARGLHRRMILAPTPRERERWHAVWLLAQGWTASAVAEALEWDPTPSEDGPPPSLRVGQRLIFEQSGGSPPPLVRRNRWR